MAIRISGNVVIPDVVGCNTTSGNTVLGINNLASLTTGIRNIAVGLCNLHTNSIGTDNIALGSCSLHGLTSGDSNVAIGYQAGSALTTGSSNTIIGNLSGTSGLTNTVLIGAGATERIKVDGTGLYINGTVFTGGGGGGSVPKITNIQITDSSYNVLDDTAVSTSGGYIKITGTDFVSGASVVVGTTSASSVSYVSGTTLNCQLPALTAGTYILYVVNPDGGTAIRVNGLTASSLPDWQTASALGEYSVDAALSIQFAATEATSYVLQAGSSLPPGLSLSSGGLLSGTPTGITSDTQYSFNIVAIDPQSQDSPRTFTITIAVTDPFFIYNALLLRADAAAQSFSTDASTNNFYATINGDVKGSEFTPYLTGWGNYFDGTGDYLSLPTASNTGNWGAIAGSLMTFEFWFYTVTIQALTGFRTGVFGQLPSIAQNGRYSIRLDGTSTTSTQVLVFTYTTSTSTLVSVTSTQTMAQNQWHHCAITIDSTTPASSTIKFFINGQGETFTGQNLSTHTADPGNQFRIGDANDGGSSQAITGYISNFRIVRGSLVYTNNFTPPTSPLTAITNTILLTCQSNRLIDNSTNNFTITRNGDVTVSSYNPFNLYNTGTGGSAYFDGTGDYLSIPYNTVFNLSTVDFTIECWFYVTAGLGGTSHLMGLAVGTSTTRSFYLFINASNFPIFGYYTDGTTAINLTSSAAVTGVTWNHIAVTRQSGTTTMFLNGVQVATSTAQNGTMYTNTSAVLEIGREAGFNGNYLTGYISNARLVKGTAVYTSNFTPPTSSLTAITNTSLLTCQYWQSSNNNTFLDTSYYNNFVTRNGNTTTSTFTPFYNNYSVYFDGTGDYLEIADNAAFNLGSEDWTAEAFVYLTALPSSAARYTIFGQWGPLTTANDLSYLGQIFNDAGTMKVGLDWSTTGNTTNSVYVAASVVTSTWIHIAWVRNGSSLKIFLNGTEVTSGNTITGTLWNCSRPFNIGRNEANGANFLNGYLSNFRLVKGTALYTTNFTPSTSSLTAITNTSLLTCLTNRFQDLSTNNFTITRNGDARVAKFSCFTLNQFYSVAQYGGSMYFDGTGDFLTLPSNRPQFTMGTGDFTIEMWVFIPNFSSARTLYDTSNQGDTNPTGRFALEITTGAVLRVFSTTGFTLTSGGTVIASSWAHIAYSRASGSGRLFINGIQVNTTYADSNNYVVGTVNRPIIGANSFDNASGPMLGNISNLRVVKGTALYTANFTPPTTPVITPTAPTSLLLTGSAAGVYDITGINTVETVANSSASTAQTKFLSASMYFDGTGDYLALVGNPELQIRNKNFTIECWVYPTAATSNTITALDNVIATGYSAIRLRMTANRQIELLISSDGGSWAASGTTSTALTLNVWSYITVVRNGSGTNNIQVYINGNSALTLTFTGTAYTAASLRYSIGAVWSSSAASEFWTGYIEDLRITNGVARYTSNFTPPVGPSRRR